MNKIRDSDARRAIDAAWRIESPRVIARLARMVGDVGLAEDFAHDALVAALEQWPASGVPDNPGVAGMNLGLLQPEVSSAIEISRRHLRICIRDRRRAGGSSQVPRHQTLQGPARGRAEADG